MTFVAQSNGRISEALRIESQKTKAESYEGRGLVGRDADRSIGHKGELGNLSLRFVGKNGQQLAGKSELYQNYPNPFDQRTVIGINLAISMVGTLKITDITGRTIKSIDRNWNHGYNEIWLDRRDIQATGILFYSFESLPSGQAGKEFTATKRMILMQ